MHRCSNVISLKNFSGSGLKNWLAKSQRKAARTSRPCGIKKFNVKIEIMKYYITLKPQMITFQTLHICELEN